MYARRRQEGADVQRVMVGNDMVPFISDLGFMVGPECTPEATGECACGRMWSEAVKVTKGQFVLRTCLGAVIRQKQHFECACNAMKIWDPATEFIYTIRDQTEGGDTIILFHIVLDFLHTPPFAKILT